MAEPPPHAQVCPLDRASIPSQLFMLWMMPAIRTVKLGEVTEAKLMALPKVADLTSTTTALKAALKKQKKLDFLRAVLSVFGWRALAWGWPQVVAMIGQMGIALIVSELVTWLKNAEDPDWYGYLLAVLMLIVSFACAMANNYVVMRFFLLGGMIKETCLLLLYEKSLRLSLNSLQKASAGKLINLVASDFEVFDYMVPIIALLFTPATLAVAGGFLWMKMRYAGLLALALAMLQMPVQRLVTRLLTAVRRRTAESTDQRLKLLSNTIEGIKLIKLYAWEQPLCRLITKARYVEFMNVLRKYLIRLFWGTIFTCGHGVVFLFTFWVQVATDNELKIADLIGVMTILLSLQFYICFMCTYAVELITFIKIACQRMTSVLNLPEIEEQRTAVSNPQFTVEVENLSASWSDEAAQALMTETKEKLLRTSEDIVNCTLYKCDLKVKVGELCMVVGGVGSGKSSLLLALLSELKYCEGEVRLTGSCAYVEQEPWIISATVRENILMGKALEEERYNAVCEACCLKEDFAIMTHGDVTIIGDRGINLSGGQKARVALARAVYSDSEVYLLDDPLSAVDAHVGAQLMEKCICGFLRDKTRILVTHQTQFLPKSDYVVLLKQGTVLASGSYQSLSTNPLCVDTFESYKVQKDSKHAPEVKEEAKEAEVSLGEKKQDKKSILQEEMSSGSVPLRIYYEYLTGAFNTSWVFAGILVTFLAVLLPYIAIPFWLQHWATQSKAEQQNLYYAEVTGLIVLGLLVASVVRGAFMYTTMLNASKNMHNKAVRHLIETNAAFFDANPSGRVMNRLSRDVALMDDSLTYYMTDTLHYVFLFTGYVVVIVVLNPYTLIPLAVAVVVIVLLLKRIVPVARDIRRVELITKSPIFSLLTQSIGGLTAIRAFSLHSNFASQMLQLATKNLRAFIHFQAQMRVFQMYTDYCFVLLIVVNIFVVVSLKGSIDPNTIGIGMSFSVVILSLMSFLCKFAAETENIMTCTQRLVEYSKLPSEGAYTLRPYSVSNGQVQFQGVFMKYREHLDYVLQDLIFTIPAGSKVGIVGRTGAGKSSILQALFRMVPIAQGSILIDGVDVESLGLHDLRKQLSVIPQFPFIFHGTVRENLDPLHERTEEELWSALAAVELADYFTTLKSQLDTVLTGNVALSVGQKQLMCLARAILRSNKILMMDEATANVDKQTDALIQSKIRERFEGCTVITIAHRLKTIIDYDLAMVMSKGSCVEFAPPKELLSNRDSEFAKMVEATGPEESAQLRAQIGITS